MVFLETQFANWGGLACDTSENPQESVQGGKSLRIRKLYTLSAGKIAVVRRGKCAFFKKVQLAQNRGASAVVIVNSEDG